jgi:hypothetical protein
MNHAMPTLERPAFFDGQRLTADDLAAAQLHARELRELHNRALHGWGIGLGLAATGERGGTTVTVTPGYALDCDGHEIVLEEARVEPIPPAAAGRFALTVSWAADSLLEPERRRGECGADGAVRLDEEPVIRWFPRSAKVAERPGLDLVLCVVEIEICAIGSLSTAERRPLPRPRPFVAAGRSPAGATHWQPWPEGKTPIGLGARVSTAEAGFSTPPVIQARLAGDRVLAGSLIEGYAFVTEVSASSFDFRLALPAGSLHAGADGAYSVNAIDLSDPGLPELLTSELGWHVVWMGVQP